MHAPFDFNFEFDADEELLLLEAAARRAHCGGSLNTVGFLRNIEVNTTPVGNVGGGLDPLHSFSLPINSLRNNGDYVRGELGGFYGANDNDKRLQFLIDGNIYEDTGLHDVDGGSNNLWHMELTVIRLSATSVRLASRLFEGFLEFDSAGVLVTVGGSGYLHFGRNRPSITVANLNTNAITFLVQGESAGAATDDVVQNYSIYELVQN